MLLDADALPEAVHQAVTRRAGGNPLFIQEVLRSLQEGGDLRKVSLFGKLHRVSQVMFCR